MTINRVQEVEAETKEVYALVGQAALGAVVLIGHALLSGFVLQCLWGWFVTPAFGLAVPSLALCLGLSLLVRSVVPSQPKGPFVFWESAVKGFVACLFFLGAGWIFHLFA